MFAIPGSRILESRLFFANLESTDRRSLNPGISGLQKFVKIAFFRG